MPDRRAYRGIDCFRLLAALLILAIHISPLSAYSATGDFILTRVLARTAVPFFWMTSGFFLLPDCPCRRDRLLSFFKKTALLYGAAIVLYLPVNFYTGYFKMRPLLPNLIKDLLFDGTMYHLWYFPASLLGAGIAWLAVKRSGLRTALLLTAALYVVGLFGDSYYGVSAQLPLLKGLYGYLFELFDYTRNGIFFAPLFFVLGGMLAAGASRLSLRTSVLGFCGCLLLMLGEGLLLRRLHWQRHDSMYVLLPACMYFLFHALTFWRGKRSRLLRTASLALYLLHPMAIVALRLLARLTHTRWLFVDNRLVQYLTLCAGTAGLSLLLAWLLGKARRGKQTPPAGARAWLEIDLDNLEHNVRQLRQATPLGCALMAVVKAEAYGHGALAVAAHLNRLGVNAFAVATCDEGIALRRGGIRGEILILGFTDPARARELRKYDLMQTLLDGAYARRLSDQGCRVKVHVKIDTGMHRLGFDCAQPDAVADAFALRRLKICGIFTHLCVPDSLAQADFAFTQLQIQRFYQLLDALKARGLQIPKTHIQSSYGLLNYPELRCDYVRAGIALYGAAGAPQSTRLRLDLRPVLSLKARVVLLRRVAAGESVGYDRRFVARRDSRIAILSIGYADGLPRALSCGNGKVLLRGRRAPVVGQICMDQLAVDVTELEDVCVGDAATLLGRDAGSELTAQSVAARTGSIANELLSRLGARLPAVTVVRQASDACQGASHASQPELLKQAQRV